MVLPRAAADDRSDAARSSVDFCIVENRLKLDYFVDEKINFFFYLFKTEERYTCMKLHYGPKIH